jgi:hypothetical protein
MNELYYNNLLLNKNTLGLGYELTSALQVYFRFSGERAAKNENGVATARGRFEANTETSERVAVS